MTNEQFDEVVQNRVCRINGVLTSKAKEYSSNIDRLHNFKAAARRLNTSPEIALQGMMEKHAVSINDMIENTRIGICPSDASVDEKIGDMINYLILLEALFKERKQQLNKK